MNKLTFLRYTDWFDVFSECNFLRQLQDGQVILQCGAAVVWVRCDGEHLNILVGGIIGYTEVPISEG